MFIYYQIRKNLEEEKNKVNIEIERSKKTKKKQIYIYQKVLYKKVSKSS